MRCVSGDSVTIPTMKSGQFCNRFAADSFRWQHTKHCEDTVRFYEVIAETKEANLCLTVCCTASEKNKTLHVRR